MHFYCHCLNVTIDTSQLHDNQVTQTHCHANDLMKYLNLSHGWLEYNMSSDIAIHVSWQSLFKSISVRDVKLNRCLICNYYTHIINVDTKRIFINKDLITDKSVKQLYHDPNYSKIAKIILPIRANDSTINLPGSQDEVFQHEYELAQQIYRQSIEDADRETEDRIRNYQHEQERILESKTETIYKELDNFLSFMRATPRCGASSTKTSPILATSSAYINENSMESGFGSDVFDSNGGDLSRQSSTIERTFSERTSNIDEDTIDDPMFDNGDWCSGKDNLSNFATSLPKDIAFQPRIIPKQNDDDSNDLERIGKSFRDLSQSLMCTDGTEVFGDLPSPRLNIRQT